MRDNFVKLMDFIFGKYMYTVMKNNDKVLYFEVVNNKYVQPISSFNLYDNEGKSLTSVNEHFFMNQLVNRINVACKKGIFISDQEIVDFLNKVKASCEDLELKKLFKGSYMTEINEFNFENNKRNIVRYLDKFKFDTFVDYNNVSVFSGSLEKDGTVQSVVEPVQESVQPVEPVVENVVQPPAVQENVQNVVESNSEDMEVVDVIDEPAVENDDVSNNQQTDIANSTGLDFMNIPIDNSAGDVVSSSDYFSNSQSTSNVEQPAVPTQSESFDFNSLYGNSVQELPVQENVVDSKNEMVQQEVVQTVESVPVQEVTQSTESIPAQESAQPVVDQPAVEVNQENPALQPVTSSVDLTAPLDFGALYGNTDGAPVQSLTHENSEQNNVQMIPNSNFFVPSFENNQVSVIDNDQGFNIDNVGISTQAIPATETLEQKDDLFHNDGFSLAEPMVENVVNYDLNNNNVMYSEQVLTPSYISDVKNRIEENAFNTELGVMNPSVTESDLDKTVVVDKVNMPPLESVSDQASKKSKKKGSAGVIIFIIVLLLVLAGFAYFLYNYIF